MAIGYHYQPLPVREPPDAFRLLVLEPGHPEEHLACHLRNASVSSADSDEDVTQYEALSYVWGTEEPSCDITLGAWRLPIRENLWLFLHEKRSCTNETILWIDTLCINQSDDSERASQVQLMDQIYLGAQRVLVWLGKRDIEIHRAMRFIEEISMGMETPLSHTSTNHNALFQLSHHLYWTRAWVVQEFLLSRDLRLLCGSERLDWRNIQKFLQKTKPLKESDRTNHWHEYAAFYSSPAFALIEQKMKQGTVRAPLMEILIRNRHALCRDPRDKIYAMLGLAIESTSKKIQVSYRKEVSHLLFEVLEYCQVPAKDVVRYVRFLLELLEIKPMDSPDGAGMKFQKTAFIDSTLWGVPGFVIGKILYCEKLNDWEVLRTANDRFKNLPISGGLTVSGRTSSAKRLEVMGKFDITGLQVSYQILKPVAQRNWPTASKAINICIPSDSPTAYRITMILQRRGNEEILSGVAYGSITKGDRVVQFLGHDTAIAVARNANSSSHSQLRACLFCSRSDGLDDIQDVVTKQQARCYTVQSEADGFESKDRVVLRMTPAELMMLAQ